MLPLEIIAGYGSFFIALGLFVFGAVIPTIHAYRDFKQMRSYYRFRNDLEEAMYFAVGAWMLCIVGALALSIRHMVAK